MDYRGIAALVLATTLGLTLFVGVAGLVWWGRPLTENGGEALIAIAGALVGALSGYIAGRHSGGNGNGADKPPPPPPPAPSQVSERT